MTLQVALPTRLCSPIIGRSPLSQTWLAAWLPACCCLGVVGQPVLGSCLCCLPKPARELCATGHLAQESQPLVTHCLSPVTHRASERCCKIWFLPSLCFHPPCKVRVEWSSGVYVPLCPAILLGSPFSDKIMSFAAHLCWEWWKPPPPTTAAFPFCFLPPEVLCTPSVNPFLHTYHLWTALGTFEHE